MAREKDPSEPPRRRSKKASSRPPARSERPRKTSVRPPVVQLDAVTSVRAEATNEGSVTHSVVRQTKRTVLKERKRSEPPPNPVRSRRNAAEDSGSELPAFVAGFPRDPELDQLVQAFEAGNYALVRKRAPELAEKSADPKVRDAALELRRRIDPDPLLRYFLGISVALLVFLTIAAYAMHQH